MVSSRQGTQQGFTGGAPVSFREDFERKIESLVEILA